MQQSAAEGIYSTIQPRFQQTEEVQVVLRPGDLRVRAAEPSNGYGANQVRRAEGEAGAISGELRDS